jgi:hypothetical protein
MDGADDHDRADELSKKTAQLSDKQRQQYQTLVNVMADFRGQVTDQYRLDIVNTMLHLPEKAQGRQLNEARDREEKRPFDQRDERRRSAAVSSAKQLGSEPTVPAQDGGKRQPARDDPMAGVQRHDAPRDYGELRRTHEQVAAKQTDERGAAADSATALLSKEQLQSMADRYAEVRKASNIELTPSEQRKDSEEAKMQAKDRERLERAHGSAPNEQQTQERALLDHQQLAEQVGSAALRLGQHSRKKGAPGAESYEREARSAFDTARRVHEQRQNLGMGADRNRDTSRVTQQQDQQKQSAAQDAERGGSAMTSEQRANASSDVKQTVDRKERAEAVRATGTEGNVQSAQQGITKPGNTRSGGRSR